MPPLLAASFCLWKRRSNSSPRSPSFGIGTEPKIQIFAPDFGQSRAESLPLSSRVSEFVQSGYCVRTPISCWQRPAVSIIDSFKPAVRLTGAAVSIGAESPASFFCSSRIRDRVIDNCHFAHLMQKLFRRTTSLLGRVLRVLFRISIGNLSVNPQMHSVVRLCYRLVPGLQTRLGRSAITAAPPPVVAVATYGFEPEPIGSDCVVTVEGLYYLSRLL